MTRPVDRSKPRTSITRTEAARLLDAIRVAMATAWCQPGESDDTDAADAARFRATVTSELAKLGIVPLVRCDGDAHSNPHIDHCGQCAPRWGWTGERIKIT